MTSDFKLNFDLAQRLGFLHFALGGSRAYMDTDAEVGLRRDRDWDFVAVVQTHSDILSMVQRHTKELQDLLGITEAENVLWRDVVDDPSLVVWEVLRFAGWATDGSKRALKICSLEHLESMASGSYVCQFGVLSARAVRHCHRYHPDDGHRLFVYQPPRLTDRLFVLNDADFLHPDGLSTAVNPGVTCDLLLTSKTLYPQASGLGERLTENLLRKWKRLSGIAERWRMTPMFYGNLQVGQQFVRYIRARLLKDEQDRLHGQVFVDSASDSRYVVFSFLPIERTFWSGPVLSHTSKETVRRQGPIEFHSSFTRNSISPFTSNSEGYRSQVRAPGSEWQSVFVKVGPEASHESSVLRTVQRHFPESCVQKLVAEDIPAGKLFFRLHMGQTLSDARLSVESKPPADGRNRQSFVNWFLEVELLRAQHVTDAYRSTMVLKPDPSDCPGQKIHRYFSERLRSDSRFLAFYSDTISTICGDPKMSAPDFVKIPLVINGTQYPPLESFFDQARKYLSPRETGGLRDLPAAFGLGDGHGGNVMVTPGGQPTDVMYIDYEVSGTHCPFLDMAKAVYNDGFFNAFYGDLLSDSLLSKPNASGITVAWNFSPDVIRIDYEADVGDVGKVIAITKLEYVLVPLLQLIAENDSSKADLPEKVLGHALLACALLTRNFSKRPDLLFLNLALGVRLAVDMRRVYAETFGWIMPRVEDWSPMTTRAEERGVAERRAGRLLQNFQRGKESPSV